jgi:hypothetical protein
MVTTTIKRAATVPPGRKLTLDSVRSDITRHADHDKQLEEAMLESAGRVLGMCVWKERERNDFIAYLWGFGAGYQAAWRAVIKALPIPED